MPTFNKILNYFVIIFISTFSFSSYHCSDKADRTNINKSSNALKYKYEKAVFHEFFTGSDTHPEHIQIDPNDENLVWFTLPGVQGIGSFHFLSRKMNQYRTGAAFYPDESVIDKDGVFWFGEQSSGSLGRFDPKTKQFSHFYAGYPKAKLNGPTIDNNGIIWITDHVNNKIVRFDPKTKAFKVLTCPTPKSWVLALKADRDNRVWYNCTDAGKIGYINAKSNEIVEYTLPGRNLGPAWLDFDSKGRVWFTLWYSDKIGCFNPVTEEVTIYSMPSTKHGPAAIVLMKDNWILFSTYYSNSMTLFHPDEKNFYSFTIPSPDSGQDDGIDIDSNGVVWFTQMKSNKISRFELIKESTKLNSKDNNATVQKVKILPLMSVKKGFIGDSIEKHPLKWD